jgi:hypothetical protein
MRPSQLIVAAAAAVVTGAAAPAAFAADAVFGGATNRGDPIVIRSDPKTQQLRSLAISWRAVCGDGMGFPGFGQLTPAAPAPGFSPSANELVVSRNAKGRFEGTQLMAADLGGPRAAITVEVSGRLKPASAGGTLHAVVKIMDPATAETVTSCETRLSWKALRKPGVVYGGMTSQNEPIVLRLNAARKRVNDVILAWHAPCTPSDGFLRSPEHFGNFPISGGRFGNPFEAESPIEGGGMSLWQYRITGRVTPTRASGALQAKVSDTDAAGAATDSCDSGGLTWKAASG